MTFHRWEVLYVPRGYVGPREPDDTQLKTRYRSRGFPTPNVPSQMGQKFGKL